MLLVFLYFKKTHNYLLIHYFLIQPQDESDDDDDDDDSDDDSSDWDNDSSDNSSSDDDSDDDMPTAGAGGPVLKGRAFWLKKTTVTKVKVEKDKLGRSEERKRLKEERLRKEAEEKAADVTMNGERGGIGLLPAEATLTPSLIQKKSLEILSSRGRKGSDPQVLLGQLEALSKLSTRFGPRVEIPVLMHVVTAQFDMQRGIDDFMETRMWRACAGHIERIGTILDDIHEGWVIGSMTSEDEELANDVAISTLMKGKGKMAKVGTSVEGSAMSAMTAEEKLINPHTVSALSIFFVN
jgi:hypothetical protein